MKPLLIRLKSVLTNRSVRLALTIAILLVTAAVFIDFFTTHPQYVQTLKHVRPVVVVDIIVLNALLTVALTIAYGFMVELCGKHLSFKENFLLTTYSSIANFFGPLQSGPGVRAVYLKTKHKIRLRDYTLATLIQYSMFAFLSALLVFVASRPWWQTFIILLAVIGVCYGVIRFYGSRVRRVKETSQFHFDKKALAGLFAATAAMIVIVTSYYFIELRAVNAHISLHQAVIYAGAANFALFVSLTPDAVGIRESFLVISRRLHHISTAVILSANLLDRGAYLLYLVLLFIFVLAVHARERLSQSTAP